MTMTHTEFSRRGGKAGRGKAKARPSAQMSKAGKKGAAVRWGKKLTWRTGQDGLAHAIRDCDPMATAWVSVCGAVITGPERRLRKCDKCERPNALAVAARELSQPGTPPASRTPTKTVSKP